MTIERTLRAEGKTGMSQAPAITWVSPYEELPPAIEYQGYEILRKDAGHSMYIIRSIGDTPLPDELSGLFTNATYGKGAIDAYLAKQQL